MASLRNKVVRINTDDNDTVTFDDKGKESKSTDILAKNILVSMVDLNEMETKFGH